MRQTYKVTIETSFILEYEEDVSEERITALASCVVADRIRSGAIPLIIRKLSFDVTANDPEGLT